MMQVRRFTRGGAVLLLLLSELLLARSVRAATLTVSTNADEDVRNGSLSLREALLLAAGNMSRPLSTAEKNQVSGAQFVETPPFSGLWFVFVLNPGVGSQYSDTIVFNSNVSIISPGGQLPNLGRNDSVNGALGGGAKVVINGSGAGGTNGLSSNDSGYAATSSRIENLAVRNFQGDAIRSACQGAPLTTLNYTTISAA